MTRVGVFGASGRMGSAVCAAVLAADDLELVAAVDPAAAGRPLDDVAGAAGVAHSGLVVAEAADELTAAGAEVAVDFTVASAAAANLAWCAAHDLHAVCGTTGLDEAARARLAADFKRPEGPNCVLATNFSLGAVLMWRCVEACAPFFDGVEVIELHHDAKVDAPSGTSLETVRRLQAARDASGAGPWRDDPTSLVALEGARGGASEAGVHVHSVRLRGLVAHQEVLFGSLGETLTIRHDALDRAGFMPGVLLAVRKVATTPGLTLGLDRLLDA